MKIRLLKARILAKTSEGIALELRCSIQDLGFEIDYGQEQKLKDELENTLFRIDDLIIMAISEKSITFDATVFVAIRLLNKENKNG